LNENAEFLDNKIEENTKLLKENSAAMLEKINDDIQNLLK
jgi:hypothetical protein